MKILAISIDSIYVFSRQCQSYCILCSWCSCLAHLGLMTHINESGFLLVRVMTWCLFGKPLPAQLLIYSGTEGNEIWMMMKLSLLRNMQLQILSVRCLQFLQGLNVSRPMIFSDVFSWIKSCFILFKMSQKFVPMSPIDNNPALDKIMVWHQIGDKPLSEPMLTWFTDVYMQH